jgi:UDP-N-acetylmuramoyl-tripeptide--D-alanyl-D-alanine ligase
VNLTLETARKATGGDVLNAGAFPRELCVVTDSRSLREGDTFLALHGERFDGHRYLADAVRAGAAAVIVDEPGAAPDGIPALVVSDTKRAYMDLAAQARAQYLGRVVAITGSAGKTTVKFLLVRLLQEHFGEAGVATAPANENNEIGVSKLLLAANASADVLVVEMGARHAGDIANLVAVARPHVGVLTNVGEAHLAIFGSRQALADTKWQLFSGGAQAILNANDAVSRERAASLSSAPRWFGIGEPVFPGTFVVDECTLAVTDATPPQRVTIAPHLPGRHNHANLAAAIAAARVVGVPTASILRVLEHLVLPPGRYERVPIGRCTYVYDAYNANASGTVATLEAFAKEPATRRIAVLASMAELGDEAPEMHRRVGAAAAASNLDGLLLGGEFAADLKAGASEAGFPAARIETFEANSDAVAWLRANTQPGDAVLLKGSRMYHLEEVLEGVRA